MLTGSTTMNKMCSSDDFELEAFENRKNEFWRQLYGIHDGSRVQTRLAAIACVLARLLNFLLRQHRLPEPPSTIR